MKKLRAIVALLLSLALPYEGGASVVQDLNCPVDGLGASMASADEVRDPMTSGMTMNEAHPMSTDADCPCPRQCRCTHHCLNAGGYVVSSAPSFALLPPPSSEGRTDAYIQLVPNPPRSSVFRPPITGAPGAA